MSTLTKIFNSLPEAIAEQVHDFSSDTIKIALCSSDNPPSTSGDSVKADLTEISYNNVVGLELGIESSSQTNGVYSFKPSNGSIAASGGPASGFQYIVLYNDTATHDNLICYYDYGSEVNLQQNQTLNITFDSFSGLFSIV